MGEDKSVRWTVALCVLATLCEGIDLQAAGVAATGLGAQFHPRPDQLGDFFSASTLGLFCGALIGGFIADRRGRKPVIVASLVLFGLFSLLTASASSMGELTGARLLTGIGLGGALPNLLALVAEASAPNRKQAHVALVYSGAPFGGAIISVIAMLSTSAQWRWIFVLGGLAPLLVSPLLAFGLRESADFRHARASAPTPVGPGQRSAQWPAAALLRGSLLWPTLLLCAASFCGLLLLYLCLSWLPTLLGESGLSRPQANAAMIAFNAGGGIAALAMGRLLEGVRRVPSVLATMLALPLLLGLLGTLRPALGLTVLLVFALGCAIIAAQAFIYTVAPALYPTLLRGAGVGLFVAIGRLGSVVGPKLGGTLKALGHGPAQVLIDLIPIAVAASVIALVLLWRVRPRHSA